VKAGLLTNLDSYAQKYGWVTRQSSKLLELNGHFSQDGVKMGEGPLWGISVTNAWIGLLMNMESRRSWASAGRRRPSAELDPGPATAKQKG